MKNVDKNANGKTKDFSAEVNEQALEAFKQDGGEVTTITAAAINTISNKIVAMLGETQGSIGKLSDNYTTIGGLLIEGQTMIKSDKRRGKERIMPTFKNWLKTNLNISEPQAYKYIAVKNLHTDCPHILGQLINFEDRAFVAQCYTSKLATKESKEAIRLLDTEIANGECDVKIIDLDREAFENVLKDRKALPPKPKAPKKTKEPKEPKEPKDTKAGKFPIPKEFQSSDDDLEFVDQWMKDHAEDIDMLPIIKHIKNLRGIIDQKETPFSWRVKPTK